MVWPFEVNWSMDDDTAKIFTKWQDIMTKKSNDTKFDILGFLDTKQITKKQSGGETEIVNLPCSVIRGIYSGYSTDAQKALQPLLDIGKYTFTLGPLWQAPYSKANDHLLDNDVYFDIFVDSFWMNPDEKDNAVK